MSLLLAGAVATSLLIIFCAIILIVQSRHDRVRRWLAFFLIFGALWSLIINLQSPVLGTTYNLWIIRLTFVAALMMIYCLFRFSLLIAHREPSARQLLAAGGLTGALITAAIAGLIIPSIDIVGQTVVPERSAGYFIATGFMLVLIISGITQLWRYYRSVQEPHERRRVGIILVGLAFAIISGILTNVVLPNVFGSVMPARFGWIAIIAWTVVLIYAVLRHQFLDIRLAAVRTVTYFVTLAIMTGIYFTVALIVSRLLNNSLSEVANVVTSLGVALFLAVLFQPIKRYFDRLTNTVFYRDNYSTDEFFARLTGLLGETTDLRTLLRRASEEVTGTLKAEFSQFYVRYGGEHHVQAGTRSERLHISHESMEQLDQYVLEHRASVLAAEAIDVPEVAEILINAHIALLLPLVKENEVIGYLFLGQQRSRDYTSRDIHTLETISDELIIAIENALYVQEVRDFNATLQKRVNEATKELRESNQQLQKLDEAKDEFVSMASHQLRTPLTSVKGYISMVLEGDAGKVTPMQKQLLEEAFTSSERMVHLINDFLNVSRLQTGKFMLERLPIDLAKVTRQEVDSLKITAQAHGLKLAYRPPAYFPVLYLDEGKLRQVIMNFIDNAIYYSKEHTSITIKLYVDSGDAVLEIHDTGIGVPKSEQAHLFSKFFRATNARKQRPDGTGVGLFLAKKVIVAHGGSMVFRSTEGEGSVFGFRLPVGPLSGPGKEANHLENQQSGNADDTEGNQ